MEFTAKQFFDLINVEYNPINHAWEDNNTLSLEALKEFKETGKRPHPNGNHFSYNPNAKVLSVYLKHTDNIYCLDIDDTRISNDDSHQKIQECFGVLPPYILSRTKGKPHYYFTLEGCPIYSNEVNIFKPFIGDLISKKKNMWEVKDNKVFEFSGELPVLQWNDIKQYFDEDKMNIEKPKSVVIPKPETTATPVIQSPNQTKLDKMVLALDAHKRAYSYDDWFRLLMLCKNLNVLYDTFLTVSKASGYSEFDEVKCQAKWNGYVANTDRKIGYKTLRDWLREDNPEEFERIEVGNPCEALLKDETNENGAKIFATYHSGEIFYTKDSGFIVYNKDTHLWKLNVDENIIKYQVSTYFKSRIHSHLIFITKQAQKDEDNDLSDKLKAIGKLLKIVGGDSWLKGTLNLLRGKLAEESEEIVKKLQKASHLLSFSNGMCYDFKERKSRMLIKEDYQTQTTGYAWRDKNETEVSTVYDFVKGLHDNKDMTKALLSALACSLYGENINEKFFVLTGEGRNGKSTIETLLKSVLGGYYASINSTQLTRVADSADKANSELGKLQYCRCVMTGEPESTGKDDKLKISTIKRWTGRDPITTRALYKDSITFDPQFTLYLLCNEIPKVSAVDGGITERMRIINFPFKFTGEEGKPLEANQKIGDITLKEKIRTEAYKYGFLHLLIDIWNETNGKFYETESIRQSTNFFFEEQNEVKKWFEEFYVVCETGRIPATELFEAFKYANKDSKITVYTFVKELKKICGEPVRSNGSKYKCNRINTIDSECMIEKDL